VPAPAASPEPAARVASSPVADAPAAPTGGPPAAAEAAAAATGAAPGPVAAAAPGADAARRAGPRIDASWSGNAAPPYPSVARRMGEQGEVRLDVRVGTDGAVLDVRLRTSSGSPTLDRAAIDTVRRWRFRPATVDGQPVAEWYRDWKWTFRIEG